jgi:hypothetical protein
LKGALVAVHSRELAIVVVIVLLALVGSQLPKLVRTLMAVRSEPGDEMDEFGARDQLARLDVDQVVPPSEGSPVRSVEEPSRTAEI